MPLDPQLQALMDGAQSAPAPAAAAAPATAQAIPSSPAGGLDPQLASLLQSSSKPQPEQTAPVPQGTVKGGAAEAAAQLGSGMLLGPASGIAGLADLAITRDPDKAADMVRRVQGLAYEPRTQSGKTDARILSAPGRWLDRLAGNVSTSLMDQGYTDAETPLAGTGTVSPAIAAGAKTAIEGAPVALGMRAPYIRPNTVNIGLNVGDKVGAVAPADAVAALRAAGAKVGKSRVEESVTEPTLVARTRAPLTPAQGDAVARTLNQDDIAQNGPEGGAVFGPKPAPFNPGLFLNRSGGRAGFPTPTSTVDPTLQAGAGMGLSFTPEQIGSGVISRTAQSLSGSAKLEREVSLKNAPVVDAAAAKAAGIPTGTQLNALSLAAAKTPWNAIYSQAARTGTVDLAGLDPTLKPFIAEARTQLRLPQSDLSSLDAGDLVNTVRQLRAQGYGNLSAPKYMPANKVIGKNQIDAANALDDALDAHVQQLAKSNPGSVPANLVDQLKTARQNLAVIATVSRAMRPGNHVFAGSLYKQKNAGAPLQGDLATIADSYGRAERSLQDVNKIRDGGPFSVLDAVMSVPIVREAGLLAASPIFARPFVRHVLAGDAFQRRAIPLPKPPPAPITPLGGALRRGTRAFPFVQPVLQQEPAAQQ